MTALPLPPGVSENQKIHDPYIIDPIESDTSASITIESGTTHWYDARSMHHTNGSITLGYLTQWAHLPHYQKDSIFDHCVFIQ